MSSKWLTLTILGFLVVQQSQSEVLECNVPNNFTVEMSPGIRSIFFGSHLQVSLDLDAMEFHSFPESQLIHIKADNVSIKFKGQIVNETSIDSTHTVERYSMSLLDQITGMAKTIPINKNMLLIYDCRILLLPYFNTRNSPRGKTSNVIRRIVESCIEDVVYVRFEELNRSRCIERVEDSICLLPTKPIVHQNVREKSAPDVSISFVTLINTLVDTTLTELPATLKVDAKGMIAIPDIAENFSTGKGVLKTNGKLNTYDGKFGNLKTLKRASEVFISEGEYAYTASCTFRLADTKLNYQHYELMYGIIKVDGQIEISINGLSFTTKISFNYQQTGCTVILKELKVTEFGEVTVQFTGLGPLNYLGSKILGWIGDKWKSKIIDAIEEKLSSGIQEKLSTFNCEQF